MDDLKFAGKKQNMVPCGTNGWKTLILTNQLHFLITYIWDALNMNVNRTKLLWRSTEKCSNHEFCWSNWKFSRVGKASREDGCVVLRHGRTCSKMRWKILRTGHQKDRATVKSFKSLLFKKVELDSVGELSKVCSQMVLKCLYLAQICRLDILLSVNKLARAVTKWIRACDRRSAWLIWYIHQTSDYRQYCCVGNTAQHCQSCPFQDSDFACDFEDSKSTSGGILCIFGSRSFVLVSWMWQKQTSVSQSSAESEIISLDAGLRMDGLLAFDLWDVVIEVLRSTNKIKSPTNPAASGNGCGTGRCWSVVMCGWCHHERTILSRWVSVIHFWRQWSSD